MSVDEFQVEGFQVRPCRPGDETAILRGFNRTFPTRRDEAHWRWVYREAPDGAEVMLCLTPDGEVAAHYAGTAHRAVYRGDEVMVGMMRDIFSVKAYRGVRRGKQAVIAETAAAFFDAWTGSGRIAFGYGFPNARHYRLGRIQMGYRAIEHWWRGGCELNPSGGAGGVALTLRRVERFDEGFDRLWERDRGRYDFAVIHDARFLNWRFAEAPGNPYWAWVCTPFLARDPSGYLVFRPRGETAWLVDFHLPSSPEETVAMWREVSSRLWARGIRRVESWAAAPAGHGAEVALLRRLGFIDRPLDENMVPVCRVFDPEVLDDACGERFHFTMADADLM